MAPIAPVLYSISERCRQALALGFLLATALLLLTHRSLAATTVLVEAESFATPGGWKVDQQFVEQMGSPFLIAHGLGTPVTNAATTVTFPETGDYAVWVRTRNWVPAFSNAAAPGRFRVMVDGVELAPEFGTTNAAWHWQYGGTANIAAGTAVVALNDLTGFDGRCDAIAFIKGSAQPPPESGTALAEWRRTGLNEPFDPPDTRQFDCVIVGGGMAGCCAAVAAARAGVRVALVQDRPFLGGNGSEEIRVGMRGDKRHPIVIELTSPGGNGDDATVADDARRLAILQAETNLTLFMPWRAYGVGTNASHRITHVDARHTSTGERARLQAPLFIDSTGDGWIGYWAGADFRMGREAAVEFDESRAPATGDAKTMGNSLMWHSRSEPAPVTFPAVPWAMEVAGTRAATSGDWNWEFGISLNTITDAEYIRDHLLRAIYGNFSNAKQVAGNETLALDWVPYIAGKRESRRLLGDHILKQSDLVNGVYFEDAIATTDWGIDLHYETAVSYLSTYTKTTIAKVFFPFRSLYSRNVPNLMMAGRCFSCTHVGLGSPRVQNTTGQMGVAVGTAAAICKQYGIEPRDIYRSADRTVELQARITGTWPQRPPPASVILDNTNAFPAVSLVGDWVSRASVPDYYGRDYLYEDNIGRHAKWFLCSPTFPLAGRYSIALRWVADSNLAANVPVWVFPSATNPPLAATDAIFIRNTQPTQSFASNEMLVGRFAASDFVRGLLRFDVSTIPAGALIASAELRLRSAGRDTNSAAGFAGADGLRLYRITESFQPSATTWTRRTSTNNWTTPGGAFDTTPLAILATPPDPDQVTGDDVLVFPQTQAFANAITNARVRGVTLDLLLRTPSLETTYPTRKIYRFANATLVLRYFTPRLPATYSVDQRTQGGQWVTLGAHDLPATGATVILGNAGANGYVIADAMNFFNASASADDYDGLPDAWERFYFLSETAARPDDDTDRDGLSNFTEFMTGTDPANPSSRFNMRIELEPTPGELVLRWPSATNRTYRIEATEDLQTLTTLATNIPATPPENSLRVAPAKPRQFYRVVLE